MSKSVDILIEELKEEVENLRKLRHWHEDMLEKFEARGDNNTAAYHEGITFKLTREINELSRVIYIITKRAT